MADELKIPNVGQLLEKYGEALVGALEKALPPQADASGELRDSIHFQIKRFGINYKFELLLADYYQWVDKGRKPGKQPPISSILKWVKDKRLVIYKGKLQTKRKGKLKKISDDAKLSNRIAFAIARNIGKRGTKATNFYTPTVEKWLKDLKAELPKALKRDVIIELKTL